MFVSVFKYEWEKFWTKKINLLMFIVIPIVVMFSLKFGIEMNTKVKITDFAFSSNMNFHITSLQEMLITAFNAIVIVLFTVSFHEEYWNGNLRLTFIRPVRKEKIYWAKFCIMIIVICMLLLFQYLIAAMVGDLFLPHAEKTLLYFKEGFYGLEAVFVYSLKYYLLALLSLITVGSVIEIISLLCKTITGAIGAGFGFLFMSGLYIEVIGNFLKGYSSENPFLINWFSGSLLYTQAKGAAYFAAGISNSFIIILILKIIILKMISYILFTKRGYLE